MTTLYLSGSITAKGVEEAQRMFLTERRRLREVGFDVINPTEYPPASEIGWVACMQRDIGLVAQSDGVALIDDSPMTDTSHGVRIEIEVARYLGLPVMSVSSWARQVVYGRPFIPEGWSDRELRAAQKPRLTN